MNMFNPLQMQLAMMNFSQMKLNSGFPMFNQMQLQHMLNMFPFNMAFMQNMANMQANGSSNGSGNGIPFNKLPFFNQ